MSRRSVATSDAPYTLKEYLAFERLAKEKHEYSAGAIIAFAGASRAHNLIVSRVSRRLGNQLEGKPCEIYVSDMRVRTTPVDYAYPDIVVVCGEPRFEDDHLDTLLNPTVLIEVLSHSTEARDRGDKLHDYHSLESLRDYVLIEQYKMRADHFLRQSSGEWKLRLHNNPEEKIRIASLDCELLLADIYEQIKFPPASPLQTATNE